MREVKIRCDGNSVANAREIIGLPTHAREIIGLPTHAHDGDRISVAPCDELARVVEAVKELIISLVLGCYANRLNACLLECGVCECLLCLRVRGVVGVPARAVESLIMPASERRVCLRVRGVCEGTCECLSVPGVACKCVRVRKRTFHYT